MGYETKARISRRGFLRGALVAGGGLAALGGGLGTLSRLASAQSNNPDAPDRYYIFTYFPGAWDVLLGLDPRDPRQFTNGNLRTTRIQPGYELVEMADADLVRVPVRGGERELVFGPYIGDLTRHADRLAVINGMSMDTLTHEVGRRRFLTGKPPSGLQARGSSAGTWLAGHFGGSEPIPQLSVQVEAYNSELPDYANALAVNSVDDLLRALRPADPVFDWRIARQMSATLAEQARCLRATPSPLWRSAEGSRQKAREMVTGGYADAFDFAAQNPLMEALRDHYGINRNQLNTPEARAALAVQAITTGISRVVSITVTGSLDTHFQEWETDQGPDQRRGFDVVARMADMLARLPYGNRGETWLDRTTIIGFSEFSRTPLINTRGGRDHHLTNSCFLLGGSVRGGQIIGASSDVGMAPQTVNLHTGAVDPEGEVIRPEHVIQSLFDEVGVDFAASDLRVPECRADLLDGCADQAIAIPALLDV